MVPPYDDRAVRNGTITPNNRLAIAVGSRYERAVVTEDHPENTGYYWSVKWVADMSGPSYSLGNRGGFPM